MSDLDLDEAKARPVTDWREAVAVILMSITAVLTAWAGYQAAKWNGESSLVTAEASALRIEATRWEADANKRQAVHVVLFSQWLQATDGRERSADYLVEHFPSPLSDAFTAWQAGGETEATPFERPEYVLVEHERAVAADAQAETLFQRGIEAGTRSEDYVSTTVVFAMVLFFTAMSSKVRSRRAQWSMVAVGGVLFVYEVSRLIAYPKLL